MRKRLLYMAVAVVALVLFAPTGIYWRMKQPPPEASTIGQSVQTFGELTERLTALAEKRGAVYAFSVLGAAELPPSTDTHLLGHAVGDILYKQKGVAGMTDCTQDFRNACSHAIVIGAMGEYGDAGAAPLIQDACRDAPGGVGAYTMCYHGLGHGVFAYFGYDLAKTVTYCKKFGSEAYNDREHIECVGGAVMELIDGGGHGKSLWVAARERYLTRDPLSPCTSALLPEATKSICLMYLTPGLIERAGGDANHLEIKFVPKAMSYCDALPVSKQELRDSCYGGFGKEFLPLANNRDIRSIDRMSDAQFAVAVAWCNYAKPADGRESCIRSELGSVMWGGETNPDAWFRFCTVVGGALQDACYQELADGIDSFVRDGRNAALCNRLPQEYQALCKTDTATAS